MLHSSIVITAFSLLLSITLSAIVLIYIKQPEMLSNILQKVGKNHLILISAAYSWRLYEYVFSQKNIIFNIVSGISASILAVNLSVRSLIIMFILEPAKENSILFLSFMCIVALNGVFRLSIKIGYELSQQDLCNPHILLIRGRMEEIIQSSTNGQGFRPNINPQNTMHNWAKTGAIATIIGIAVSVAIASHNMHKEDIKIKLKKKKIKLKKEKMKMKREEFKKEREMFEAEKRF